MSERRNGEPNFLGSASAVLEGPDGAGADRGRRARGRGVRAGAADRGRSRPARTRPRSTSTGCASSRVEVLGDEGGPRAVRQLRRFRDLQELDLPVILLVGGGTGTGKSTVATEVAYRLGITRVTSTDFVRQTMRAFFSKEFMPSIHYSSFEAGLGLTRRGGGVRRRCAARLPRPDAERARRRRGRDPARARRGLVDGARGRPPRARDVHDRARGRARRPVRARDPRRGDPLDPLLDPRRHLRRRPAGRQVHRRAARDPADPGVHRRARARGTTCP